MSSETAPVEVNPLDLAMGVYRTAVGLGEGGIDLTIVSVADLPDSDGAIVAVNFATCDPRINQPLSELIALIRDLSAPA
jgi:hypothetical protein